MYKPGGFCSREECSCQHGDGFICRDREFKSFSPKDRFCGECGYDRGDHRAGRPRQLLHKGRKP